MPTPAAIRSVTGMNTHQPVISVSDLRMRYGKHEALAGLSFEVHCGELFALIGPNGAGKTSTVEILEGYRRRTSGTVSVLGTDPWQAGPSWRARIGVMRQETGPEPDLTVAECCTCTVATTATRHAVCGSSGGKLALHVASPLPMLGTLAAWADRAGLDLPDLEVRAPPSKRSTSSSPPARKRRPRHDQRDHDRAHACDTHRPPVPL
jgi:energy-coupling factor transporter ATP-binding protein EcfA2